MIYATHSILPSRTANSVQSAHMAVAWDRFARGLPVIYRSDRMEQTALEHFSAYGLEAPEEASAIPVRAFDDSLHIYLASFARALSGFAGGPLVYTRSSRLAWIAARAGRSVVLELHDPLIPIRARFLRRFFGEGGVRLLVATTERLKRDLIGQVGIPEDSILVAGGAASAGYLTVPTSSISEHKAFSAHVGYAGSALRGKGVGVILQCARKMPDVAFHLIGPGPAVCERFGPLSTNVIPHDYLGGDRVIALLKAMDALLLPNQANVIIRSGADIGQHTSPLKLFEYMSTGRPIIASDLPVFDGILRHGENSLRVAPGDVAGFCRAIRELLENPERGDRLAAVALSEFKGNYTWDHRVSIIARFMESKGLSVI